MSLESGPWPTNAWPVTDPESQGVDSEGLVRLLEEIRQENYAIDSVQVVRHGYLILDAYRFPYDATKKHAIHSVTKSIVSALIGIAIAEGQIEGVDKPVLDILADRWATTVDTRKQDITLENLLTMSSGLDCQDSYLYRWQGLAEMRASEDWVQHVLDLPRRYTPGTHFEYCNGGSFLLAAILQEATDQSARAFADTHLFQPLGISDVAWPENPQGINIGWGEMRLRPHDMAKIGYLYLRNGAWEDNQVVPASWVEASTRRHITANTLQEGYGYQWWIADAEIYMALGYRGQYIIVVPEADLVVVFTSDLPDHQFTLPDQLTRRHILPAAAQERPLSSNPAAVNTLGDLVRDFAQD